MTRKMESAYWRYRMSDKDNLYKAYNSFSQAKADAWEHCEELCKKYNGKGLKVIGANSNFFSAGFLFEEDGKEMFMFITHGGNYKEAV